MALKDYPDLHQAFDRLQEEKALVQARAAPFRTERDALLNEIQPKLDRIRQLEGKYREIEQPRLAQLDGQISAIARATGGRVLSEGE